MSIRKRKHVVGSVYGNRTIVEYPYKSKKVLVRCNICGDEKWIRISNLTSGASKNCWECRKTTPAQKTYRMIKYQAEVVRGIEFNVSFGLWMELSQKPCYYCGEEPSNDSHGFKYNGLDRVDTSQSYYYGNVQTCCRYCNMAKSDQELQEFIERSIRIAKKFNNMAVLSTDSGSVWMRPGLRQELNE